MFSHNLPETPLSSSLAHYSANSNPITPLSSSNILNLPSQPTQTASSTKKSGKWTPEEDNLLRKYVSMFSEKQWRKVSEYIPGRSPIQCLHRWTKILKPGLVKGPWTPAEDQKLIDWVKKEGPGKWSQASNLIPGRSGKQCRERWFNNLDPDVKKGNWSTIEDELIFKLYQKHGSSWSKIAKYLPGRTENSIKNRFYSTLRRLAAGKGKPDSPDGKETEPVEREANNMKEEAGSSHPQELNLLFNLLQEVACNEKPVEKKQDDGEVNVKQEEGVEKTEKEVKEKKTDKPEMKGNEEKGKTPGRVDQEFNLCGEKVVLARDTNLSKQAVQKTAAKLLHADIEENDPNFERFVFVAGDNFHNVPVKELNINREDSSDFLDDLDSLQKSVMDFCNHNVHDLMSAFKIISAEPSFPLKNEIGEHPKPSPRASHITPIYGLEGHSSVPSKQGFQRRQSFDVPQKAIAEFGPLIPVSIKIPPLDGKENDQEVRTAKMTPLSKKDLSDSISVFPKKTTPEKLPGVLENRHLNIEELIRQGSGIKEFKDGKEAKEEEAQSKEMNGLIGSINDTIGIASVMYAHYLSQITETAKSVDKNDIAGAAEKLGPLLQQLYGLESWLRSAKTDLVRLESFTQGEKDMGSAVKFAVGEDENKRKMVDDDVERSDCEQVLKKRKVK